MMEEAAEALDFEKAARLRDRIRAIEKISEHQKVVFSKVSEQDVVALAQNGRLVCAVVLIFRGSKLVDKKDYLLGEVESMESARSEFLMRFYERHEIPPQIGLDEACDDQELFEAYLSEKAGRKVHIHVPQRGEQHDLVTVSYTHLDVYKRQTRGGAALSVKAVTGKPIKFVGMGEKLEDLEPFHPGRMASRILGMGDVLSLIEKAQEHIDEKNAEELAKKLKENSFDLNDLLVQMQQLKKMGPLQQVMSMLPGASKAIKDEDAEKGEAQLKLMESDVYKRQGQGQPHVGFCHGGKRNFKGRTSRRLSGTSDGTSAWRLY